MHFELLEVVDPVGDELGDGDLGGEANPG